MEGYFCLELIAIPSCVQHLRLVCRFPSVQLCIAELRTVVSGFAGLKLTPFLFNNLNCLFEELDGCAAVEGTSYDGLVLLLQHSVLFALCCEFIQTTKLKNQISVRKESLYCLFIAQRRGGGSL